SSEAEARMAIRWAVENNPESTYIRFVNVPMDLPFGLPPGYQLKFGQGVCVHEGDNGSVFAYIIAYGPLMLTEAVKAAKRVQELTDYSLSVFNIPWLNRIDADWINDTFDHAEIVFTLDNHYIKGGQGEYISGIFGRLGGPIVVNYGLEEIPACGLNDEVLKYHKLDYLSIADRITDIYK
ncbi:MAG: transketolase C-terminal domain-containing protein, partial [Patescibacteria group bacterium]